MEKSERQDDMERRREGGDVLYEEVYKVKCGRQEGGSVERKGRRR